jgi:hypothetical protein
VRRCGCGRRDEQGSLSPPPSLPVFRMPSRSSARSEPGAVPWKPGCSRALPRLDASLHGHRERRRRVAHHAAGIPGVHGDAPWTQRRRRG